MVENRVAGVRSRRWTLNSNGRLATWTECHQSTTSSSWFALDELDIRLCSPYPAVMFNLSSRTRNTPERIRSKNAHLRFAILLALIVTGIASFWPTLVRLGHADDPGHQPESIDDGSGGDESPGESSPDLPDSTSMEDHHEETSSGHTDPVTPLLAAIAVILLLAKIVGDISERFGMPAVLGELVLGVLLGNVVLTGWQGLEFLKAPDAFHVSTELTELEALESKSEQSADDDARIAELQEHIGSVDPYSVGAILKMLASIGVVLLLFEVGLESQIDDMLAVGASALLVAVLGVVAPILLGVVVGRIFLPEQGWQVHLFLGATLCATSVGITARVLKDMGRSQQRESRIILGAAVIDDVLGLLVLAVVGGIIQQGEDFQVIGLVAIIAKALGFLAAAVLLGSRYFAQPLFRYATTLRGHGLLVTTALVICFGMAWVAGLVGLAPIVGAFAAGLILEHAHYAELGTREEIQLEQAVHPLVALMVPIFFVQMGIMVDLKSFADPSVWGLAASLTFVAILGKQVCAFGVLEKGLDRMSVGIGMIPRGEVGLIFASVGKELGVMDDAVYSSVLVMVMLTTMVTPPVLKWSMNRRGVSSDSTGAE